MSAEPVRSVRDHLSEVVDRADREHDRTVITRNGRPSAVIIGYEDLQSIEETLELLSDPNARAEINEAEEAVATGDVVSGVEAVRALRSRP